MKLFLIQCALFLLQLYLWIFLHTIVGAVTVPLGFCFVLFALWSWYRTEH
jgi:hypothetical protein